MLEPTPTRAEPVVPTRQQIEQLWHDYGVPDHIRRHSQLVCSVAMQVAEWLRQAGTPINAKLVYAGALLHDIAKARCLGSDRRHDEEGARIVAALGYREVANLVRYHVRLPPQHPVDEATLVYYADKRVKHDELVGLRERFDDIVARYAGGDPRRAQQIERGFEQARQVERQIFELLGGAHEPQELTKL